jgi:hypothetical protein
VRPPSAGVAAVQQIALTTWDWATLLKRVWGFDALTCTGCGGRMRFIAVINDRAVIERILTRSVRPRPSRSSPTSLHAPLSAATLAFFHPVALRAPPPAATRAARHGVSLPRPSRPRPPRSSPAPLLRFGGARFVIHLRRSA